MSTQSSTTAPPYLSSNCSQLGLTKEGNGPWIWRWWLVAQVCLTLRCYGLQPGRLLSMGFSRQEYWSGLPFPFPVANPDPGIEPASPALAGKFFTESPGKPRALGSPAIKPHYPLHLTGSQSKSSLKPAETTGHHVTVKIAPNYFPPSMNTTFSYIYPRLSYLISFDQWGINQEM